MIIMKEVTHNYNRTLEEVSCQTSKPQGFTLKMFSDILSWISIALSVLALMCLHGWLSSHRLNSNLLATAREWGRLGSTPSRHIFAIKSRTSGCRQRALPVSCFRWRNRGACLIPIVRLCNTHVQPFQSLFNNWNYFRFARFWRSKYIYSYIIHCG